MHLLRLCQASHNTEQSSVLSQNVRTQVQSAKLLGRHFQQICLSDGKKTPSLLGGQISCTSSLVELNRLCVVFCYNEMHGATAGLHCRLGKGRIERKGAHGA